MGTFFSSEEQLLGELEKVRSDPSKKIVFTNGCFDLLHVGHIKYLQEARSQGDYLIVAINSDQSVKLLKGESRPIQCEEDRAEILSALECVNATVIFTEETPLRIIKKLEPNVLVKGGDWLIDKIVGAKEVLENGGEVKSLQFVQGRSTSSVVEKIIHTT